MLRRALRYLVSFPVRRARAHEPLATDRVSEPLGQQGQLAHFCTILDEARASLDRATAAQARAQREIYAATYLVGSLHREFGGILATATQPLNRERRSAVSHPLAGIAAAA